MPLSAREGVLAALQTLSPPDVASVEQVLEPVPRLWEQAMQHLRERVLADIRTQNEVRACLCAFAITEGLRGSQDLLAPALTDAGSL